MSKGVSEHLSDALGSVQSAIGDVAGKARGQRDGREDAWGARAASLSRGGRPAAPADLRRRHPLVRVLRAALLTPAGARRRKTQLLERVRAVTRRFERALTYPFSSRGLRAREEGRSVKCHLRKGRGGAFLKRSRWARVEPFAWRRVRLTASTR